MTDTLFKNVTVLELVKRGTKLEEIMQPPKGLVKLYTDAVKAIVDEGQFYKDAPVGLLASHVLHNLLTVQVVLPFNQEAVDNHWDKWNIRVDSVDATKTISVYVGGYEVMQVS